jgi:hypothetical protein
MNTILTAYFNSYKDDQRNIKWEADIENIRTLVETCKDYKLVVLTDCLKEKPKEWTHVTFVNTKINFSPYFARWKAFYDYLIKNPSIEKVFMVDATDVELLREPFNDLDPNKIYIGDEKDIVDSDWLKKTTPDFAKWFDGCKLPLLNCGIVGGYVQNIVPLLFDINISFMMFGQKLGLTDMAIFNFIIHTKYSDVVEHGFPLNSHFNKFETDSKAKFKHK